MLLATAVLSHFELCDQMLSTTFRNDCVQAFCVCVLYVYVVWCICMVYMYVYVSGGGGGGGYLSIGVEFGIDMILIPVLISSRFYVYWPLNVFPS